MSKAQTATPNSTAGTPHPATGGPKLSFSPPGPVFYISADARMPDITVTLTLPAAPSTGSTPAQSMTAPSIAWKVTLVLNPAGVPHAVGRTTTHPPIAATGGTTFKIPFTAVRGGTLTVTATTMINGKQVTETLKGEVLGTDPTLSGLRTQALPDALIQQMAVETTTRSQFLPHGHKKGYPLFSHDNLGGVGLGQITKPHPTDDEVWDWKANARAALRLFRQKEADAKQALENYRKGARFKALVAAYNAARANGKAPQTPRPAGAPALTAQQQQALTKPLTVTLPQASQEMIENDTIRRYNGEPVIGEYVAMTTDGLLKVTPSADGVSGTAEWHEVSAQERKDAYDDYTSRTGKAISKNAYDAADYVGKVRGVPLN